MNNIIDKKQVLFCSSVSPQLVSDGRLLIYRHLCRLQSHELVLAVPENSPPDELHNVAQIILVPNASIWLWRLRRSWLFPFGDWVVARHVKHFFKTTVNPLKTSAVLTVFVPDPFMTAAAEFAKKHGLPLILFCHDDYEDNTPRSFRPVLATIYRQAAARLCVSRPMADEFRKRYGVQGTVLPPIPSAPSQPPLDQKAGSLLRVGFAGSVGVGYEEAMLQIADNLKLLGGQLVIASPSSRKLLPRIWSHPAVFDLGQLAPDKVREAFQQAGVNVLGVVQSFDPKEERAFRFNFPSKLTEYSTFGLPLLIVAPESASAVVWAMRIGNVAAVATDLSSGLKKAVDDLNHSQRRHALAMKFFEAAAEFDPETNQAIFEATLNAVYQQTHSH